MNNVMKSVLGLTLLTLLLAAPLWAVPNSISYQGVLTDSGGNPLTGSQTIIFSLFSVATGGAPLWQETQNVSLQNGTYQVQLGAVTPLSDTVFAGTLGTWLEVAVGGQTLSPRQHLDSVPYAFQAKRADSAASADNAATQADFTSHTGNSSAHHTRYTSTEAVSAVANSNLSPYGACTGADQAMQWSGSQWICVNLKQLSPSGGKAKGFELTDSWGETWDGVPRSVATWAEADTACTAAGGRLPTMTEIYRNNGASGSGDLVGILDTSNLWTQIVSGSAGSHMSGRLSDGTMVATTNATKTAYRCLWPDTANNGFSGDSCYGPAGSECWPVGLLWNVDTLDRPTADFAAAANECRFYDASLPTTRDFQELIQDGWGNPSTNWLWAADSKYWYNQGFGYPLARWTTVPQPDWGYSSMDGTGTRESGGVPHTFRCIGKQPQAPGVAIAADPGCIRGKCFSLNQRKTPLVADNEDRPAAVYDAAVETCRSLGAELPTTAEISDLIHAGWAGGSNAWLYSADPLYWYPNGFGVTTYRWSGTGSADWMYTSSTMNRALTTSSLPYRCVWHQRIEPVMNHCKQNARAVWNGSSYGCQPAAVGDSGGNANPNGTQLVDDWGNAWDLIQRSADTFANADAACQSLGGRLPTATEVYRVRANQSLATSIGDINATGYLWTRNPSPGGKRFTIRVSDGITTPIDPTSTAAYRCVWPGQAGDIFGSRACYGDPTASDGCVTSSDLRMDSYDRAVISQPAAAWECNDAGGHLPTMNELQQLIHAGAPNGSYAWLWSSNPIYWYSGGYGYGLFRWSGAGSTTWSPTDLTFNLSAYDTPRSFRCVYSNTLK